MATAVEIINRVKHGENVFIPAHDTFEFLRECVRHGLSCGALHLTFANGKCKVRLSAEGRQREKRG